MLLTQLHTMTRSTMMPRKLSYAIRIKIKLALHGVLDGGRLASNNSTYWKMKRGEKIFVVNDNVAKPGANFFCK